MAEPVWKPVGAGLLVVVAVAMVGRNLVAPGLGRDDPSASSSAAPESVTIPPAPATDTAATDPSGPPSATEPPAPPAPSAEPVGTSLLSDWIADPGRDPFGSDPRRTTVAKLPGTRQAEVAAPAKPSAAKHRLTAIAWGTGKLALVDGTPVGIGDSLLGGRVVDIRSDRLVLHRGTSDTLLRFWEGRKP